MAMSAIRLYRVYRALHQMGVPLLPRFLYAVNRIVFSVVLPPTARLGRGVLLGYEGLAIVIHQDAVLGDRVVVSPGVTIGGTGTSRGVPVIDDDVRIGAGAKVLGPIRIGRGARIGANAVVLSDVPEGMLAVGLPARVVGPVKAETD
jgi:serine O-acetyltransferase